MQRGPFFPVLLKMTENVRMMQGDVFLSADTISRATADVARG